jgi:oxygen-independent coproporphyrinogen-3 oxidase
MLPLANDCEITLEGRVSGLSPELIEAAIVGGVNRFSIGVQSFDTDIRQATGRIDDRETVIATLKRLCSHDQAAVVIDLVYGFPGQTMQMWEQDIYTLQELTLDGVDLYQLNLLPHTTLARMVKDGTSKPAATLPEQSAMYARGVELMQELHWQRLSISHWRTGNRERSLYNRLVKSGAPILAYGCGAGGSLHGYRYANSRDYATYMQQIEDGVKPLAMLAYPAQNRALANLISDGFDLGMLNLQAVDTVTGVSAIKGWSLPLLQQWQQAGLLNLNKDWLELTRAGEFWQVTMAQALLNVCEEFTTEETVEA